MEAPHDVDKPSQPEMLKGLYKEAPIGLCYLDADLRYIHINDWLAAINGLPAEQHLGKTSRCGHSCLYRSSAPC